MEYIQFSAYDGVQLSLVVQGCVGNAAHVGTMGSFRKPKYTYAVPALQLCLTDALNIRLDTADIPGISDIVTDAKRIP